MIGESEASPALRVGVLLTASHDMITMKLKDAPFTFHTCMELEHGLDYHARKLLPKRGARRYMYRTFH